MLETRAVVLFAFLLAIALRLSPNSSVSGAAASSILIRAPAVPNVLKPPTPSGGIQPTTEDDDAELRPGLFQGDIAIDSVSHGLWKVGLRWDIFPERLWPNATVPYTISPLYETTDRVTIQIAIRIIQSMTCVRFVPWSGSVSVQPDYLMIWPIQYPRGCWSYVGRTGGAQIVSLQPPSDRSANCLGDEGRAIHELMHALGIFHEQSRSDRDRFVKVHWDNIHERYRGNFERQSKVNTTFTFEYDYASIMHYGQGYFAIDRKKPTLSVKQSTGEAKGVKIGQRRGLSVTDCLKINQLYGCLDKSEASKRKFYARCRQLGL